MADGRRDPRLARVDAVLDPAQLEKAVFTQRWSALATAGTDVRTIATWDRLLARDPRVLVPVDVQAFVGTATDPEVVVAVGGTRGDPEPFDAGAPAAAGIHLHWALPDALLRAERDETTGDPRWRPLPDRWVVVRHLYPVGARAVHTTGWFVDAATGTVTPLEEVTGRPTSASAASTMSPLDAVAAGTPLWTATYAASRDRFAFHDPLTDLDALRAAFPAGFHRDRAAYTVAGWWSSADEDPLASAHGRVGLTAAAQELGWEVPLDDADPEEAQPDRRERRLKSRLGMTAPDDGREVVTLDAHGKTAERTLDRPLGLGIPVAEVASTMLAPAPVRYHSLLHGSVLGVPVDGSADGYDERPEEGAFAAAAGTDLDDVAAAFAAPALGLGTDRRLLAERLMAAFTAGTLSSLGTTDGLADLEEREHADGFTTVAGAPLPGSHDDVLREGGSSPYSPQKVGRLGRGAVADAAFDTPVVTWLDPVRMSASARATLRGARPGARAATSGPPQATRRTSTPTPAAATGTGAGSGRTVPKAPPRMFRPAPLVVGLRGVAPHHRHHGDGLHEASGLLRCRRPSECVPGVPGVVDGRALVPTLGSGAVPEEVLLVVREASVLDGYHSAWLAAAGRTPGTDLGRAGTRMVGELTRLYGADARYDGSGALAAQAVARSGARATKGAWAEHDRVELGRSADVAALLADFSLLPGTPPSPVAVTTWRQPWVPLFLEWEVRVDGSGTLDGWELVGTDLEGAPATTPLTRTLRGRAPLHRGVGRALTEAIAAWLAAEQARDLADPASSELDDADETALAGLSGLLAPLDLASASLDGMTEQLLGVVHDGMVLRDESGHPVADDLPLPLVGGTATVTALRLVDAFGRTRRVPHESLLTTSVLDTGTPATVRMRPRVLAGARWLFRLVDPAHPLTADPAAAPEAWVDQLHPDLAVSPVCGFLLPDHIDEACEVFDRDGHPLGQVMHDTVTDAVTWEPAPGRPVPPDAGPLVDLPPHAQHAGLLATGLVRADVAARTAGDAPTEASALTALLRAVDTTLWTVDTYAALGSPTVAGLVGRPIAVVRATLRLELAPDVDDVTVTAPGGAEARRAAFEVLAAQRFPVRVGELGRADDSVLGFFVDDDYEHFHVVDKAVAGAALDTGRHRGQLGLLGAVATPPVRPLDHPYLTLEDTLLVRPGQTLRLTVLMLPAGRVHLTSGITPRKHLALADDWVTPGLRVLSPSMRVGPVLVDPAEIRLPKVAAFGQDQVFTRRTGPLTWRDDPIIAASSSALLPPMPHESQEGWIRVSPARPDPEGAP